MVEPKVRISAVIDRNRPKECSKLGTSNEITWTFLLIFCAYNRCNNHYKTPLCASIAPRLNSKYGTKI